MRRTFQIGIAPLLALCTATVTLVLTFALVELIGITASQQVETDIGQGLAELAFQTTDKLDRGMYERYREVQLMAERYEITEKAVPTSVKRAVLESMQATYPYYAWIGLTDTSGKVLVSTKGMLEGADVSNRPWYIAAYRDQHLTDVHEAILLAKLLPNPANEPKRFFDVAFAYRQKDGEIAGILGTHLSWQWAKDIENSVLQPLARRASAEAIILSRTGNVLLGPKAYMDRDVNLERLVPSNTKRSGFAIETWPDGKRYLVGYSHSQGYRSYPGLGWTVLVRQDIEDAYRPVHALKRKILLGGLAASVLTSMLLWAVAKRVTGPLRTITRYADALRLGKAAHIPPIGSRLAEVSILESTLNALLDNLRSKETGLREVNSTLEARVQSRTEDLHIAVEETRMNERRVRAIIDTALDAFIGVDSEGNITDWNPRAHEIFGWTRDEVLGRPVDDIIAPRFQQTQDKAVKGSIISGTSDVVGKRLQLSAVRRSGEEFPVEMTIGLIEAGGTHFFGAFIQDISVRKKIEDELARERELLNAVLDSIDVGVVVCTQAGEITLFNRAARELHGLPAERISPDQWALHYDLFAADGQSPFRDEQIPLFRALSGEVVKNAEMIVKPKNSREHFLFASGRAMHAPDGSMIGAVIAMKDVTDLKESERKLEASERLVRTIADNLPVLISYLDKDERYQFANATYDKWFGIPPADLIGKTLEEAFGAAFYEEAKTSLHRTLSGQLTRLESQVSGPSGVRYIELLGIPDTKNGVTRGAYVLTSDITAIKTHQEELGRLARSDTLTGLPNRRSYEERLDEALRRTKRTGDGLALMFLDIDNFKQINDTLGHAGGDAVLQEFGRRLKGAVRATDIVSRLAGDEFTIVLEGLDSPREATIVAEKVIRAFTEPVRLKDTTWKVSTSIGIAFVKATAIDIPTLGHQADKALYRAKASGKNQYALF